MAIDTTQAAAPYSGPVDPFKDPTFRHGEVETDLDRRFLAGDIVARITESDGESPARIIDANEDWHVDVREPEVGAHRVGEQPGQDVGDQMSGTPDDDPPVRGREFRSPRKQEHKRRQRREPLRKRRDVQDPRWAHRRVIRSTGSGKRRKAGKGNGSRG